jgi:hypothetical protein
MRFENASRSLSIIALILAVADCVTTSCTEMACSDQVGFELSTATGEWADGTYELAVHADGQSVGSCTFRFPDQLPHPAGGGGTIPCGDGFSLTIANEAMCRTGCDNQSCWQGCTPIYGKFLSRVSVQGTPQELTLSLVRDGRTLLDQTVQPAYRTVYPNGPECGGACKQAKFAASIP